jgi:hypothetical protein
MMKALMTNALSRQFNWSGTKDKNNFSALGIATVICGKACIFFISRVAAG